MLFNEPKLLKSRSAYRSPKAFCGFSALQRAEIAEITPVGLVKKLHISFSALQRAEIAEICGAEGEGEVRDGGFSALQRAEIAEIRPACHTTPIACTFQCSSTSRNC